MLFGKLPATGDFVSRGLDPDARARWDDWLSGSLAAAADALGDRFADRFDGAPPWRFVQRDEAGWTAGALAPSADRAGRRFPVMVARTRLPADRADGVAEALEGVLYDAIGGGWDADAAAAACASVPLPSDRGGATSERWWTLGGGVERDVTFAPATLGGAWPANLIAHMLNAGAPGEQTR